MFCTNCGSQFEEGNAFCPNCGSKVESVAQPIAEPAPVAQPITEPAPVATPVAAAPVIATPVEPAPAPQAVPIATPVQPVETPQPVYAAPQGPVASEECESLAKNILTMGIVSIVFACTFWLSLVGIIFGGIGLSKSKKFIEQYGQLYGKAKVGKYLSLGGLIGSCVVGGIAAIYFLALIITLVAGAASYY